MARGGRFFELSLALHGVLLGALHAGADRAASRARPPEATFALERTTELAIEGENLAPSERSPHRTVAAVPAAAAAHPAPSRPAPRGVGAGAHAPTGANEGSKANAIAEFSNPSAAGAARSVFGSSVLRAFLLALSADPFALGDASDGYVIRYGAGEGVAPRVTVSPSNPAGLRIARALDFLLARATANGESLAGSLAVDVSDEGTGVFTITCDAAAGTGSVLFTSGRRARLRETRP